MRRLDKILANNRLLLFSLFGLMALNMSWGPEQGNNLQEINLSSTSVERVQSTTGASTEDSCDRGSETSCIYDFEHDNGKTNTYQVDIEKVKRSTVDSTLFNNSRADLTPEFRITVTPISISNGQPCNGNCRVEMVVKENEKIKVTKNDKTSIITANNLNNLHAIAEGLALQNDEERTAAQKLADLEEELDLKGKREKLQKKKDNCKIKDFEVSVDIEKEKLVVEEVKYPSGSKGKKEKIACRIDELEDMDSDDERYSAFLNDLSNALPSYMFGNEKNYEYGLEIAEQLRDLGISKKYTHNLLRLRDFSADIRNYANILNTSNNPYELNFARTQMLRLFQDVTAAPYKQTSWTLRGGKKTEIGGGFHQSPYQGWSSFSQDTNWVNAVQDELTRVTNGGDFNSVGTSSGNRGSISQGEDLRSQNGTFNVASDGTISISGSQGRHDLSLRGGGQTYHYDRSGNLNPTYSAVDPNRGNFNGNGRGGFRANQNISGSGYGGNSGHNFL